MFRVFTRTWWAEARPGSRFYPGLEPCPGRKHTINRCSTYLEAVACCKAYNDTHRPGRYSRKAEFTEE